MWGPIDKNSIPLRNKANDYLIDRNIQKKKSFTGIDGIPNQDAAVQESMGPIVDRSKEHLGTSDSAIIAFRKLLLRLAKELRGGKIPAAASHGDWYNIRSASVLLDQNVDWQDGSAHLVPGRVKKSAAD